MKKFDFSLDKFQLSRMMSSFREKRDIINLWMTVIKLIISYSKPDDDAVVGMLVLHVDKMSRIFISSDEKSFSTTFPFVIYENGAYLEFGSTACPVIDSKITSDIISLINASEVLDSRNVLAFAEPLMEIVGEPDMVWELFRDLMLCDDGYIRIDHDPANENGKIHPLDHIDIFYSQSATFKIGLLEKPNLSGFHDILNYRTDCHFLTAP
jgi:hypothetical protein